MRVLAGDIGGTKTAVAIVRIGARRLSLERSRKYPSARHACLEEILEDFLGQEPRRPRYAGFGVAGPVVAGRSSITKLPWTVDERTVSRTLQIPRVRVENDFVAAALGIPYLTGRQVVTVSEGEAEPGGPVALLGAGTGLGQAALWRSGGKVEVLPSEGGHADFGPRTPHEDRLVRFVRARFGRVSRDRLLSGEGMGHVYDFLKEDGAAPESARVARAFEKEDRAAVIGRLGLKGDDPLCALALATFASIYGSEAGNLALQYRATGGVYVGGGIAVRILPALRTAAFLDAFRSKPPMEDLLARIPVRIVRDSRLGLFGAAAAAYRMAIETTRPSSTSMRREIRG
ncbi:MAG: glucokinase [Acidobacteriota bacterium]|nr:glucokinase [Acidobacteriota bacterium]